MVENASCAQWWSEPPSPVETGLCTRALRSRLPGLCVDGLAPNPAPTTNPTPTPHAHIPPKPLHHTLTSTKPAPPLECIPCNRAAHTPPTPTKSTCNPLEHWEGLVEARLRTTPAWYQDALRAAPAPIGQRLPASSAHQSSALSLY